MTNHNPCMDCGSEFGDHYDGCQTDAIRQDHIAGQKEMRERAAKLIQSNIVAGAYADDIRALPIEGE